MVDIAGLPVATVANPTDILPATQGSTGPNTGVTRGVTVQKIINAVNASAAVTAAGTTQATALLLSSTFTVVNSVPAGAGVVLPTSTASLRFVVYNDDAANSLLVYPDTGSQFEALGANVPISIAPGGRVEFVCTAAGQWYAR